MAVVLLYGMQVVMNSNVHIWLMPVLMNRVPYMALNNEPLREFQLVHVSLTR